MLQVFVVGESVHGVEFVLACTWVQISEDVSKHGVFRTILHGETWFQRLRPCRNNLSVGFVLAGAWVLLRDVNKTATSDLSPRRVLTTLLRSCVGLDTTGRFIPAGTG